MWLLLFALRSLPRLQVHATPINDHAYRLPTTTTIHNAFSYANNFELASSCQKDQRTAWGITYGCLATIFACTWIAIHPNVPPNNHWWTTLRRRLILWFYALIAPETIVFWAMRQWYAAGIIAKKYEAQGWTRTHGFFLQMGGFVVYDGLADTEGSPRTVSPPEFNEMAQSKSIVFPTVTEDEIQDRSKGDILGKGIVTLQTLWFILQCIARTQQNLSITKLEVVTLALAALNAVVYFLWWYKPLDVKCPVSLVLVLPTDINAGSPSSDIPSNGPASTQMEYSPPQGGSSLPFDHRFSKWCRLTFTPENLFKILSETLVFILYILIYPIAWVFFAMFLLNAMTGNVDNSLPGLYTRFPNTDTPLFYAPEMPKKRTMFAFAFAVAGGFGAVHFIAWNFTFVTPVEQLLWRITSVSITGLPLAYVCFMLIEWASEAGAMNLPPLLWLIRCWPSSSSTRTWVKLPQVVVGLWKYMMGFMVVSLFVLGVGLYVLSRLYMIIEAFVSLRSIPPAALQDVEWTKYIPHI